MKQIYLSILILTSLQNINGHNDLGNGKALQQHHNGLIEKTSYSHRNLKAKAEKSHIEFSKTKLPSPRSDLATALALSPTDDGDLDLGIYLFGGCDRYEADVDGNEECVSVTDNTWVFLPIEDEFIDRRYMPRRRFRHQSVTIADEIWVLSGRDQDHNLISEIDVYYPQQDKWITLPAHLPPDLQVSDAASFVRGTSLYIVGGYGSSYQAMGTTFMIDTEATVNLGELVYSILDPLDTPRGDVNAVLFGRYAYVVGGFTHENGFCAPLATTEIFDIVKNEWFYASDLNIARGDVDLVIFNGRIFALGGETTHLDPSSAVCKKSISKSASNTKKFVAKTYPVNSVEILIPNQSESQDNVWKLAYSDFLPPDNAVFRTIANAYPEKSVIYAFGGVSYDGEESDESLQTLKASDKVTLYVDDFKHGKFKGKALNGSASSKKKWIFFGFSSSSILLFILLTCGLLALKRHYMDNRRSMLNQGNSNYRFDEDIDDIGLVEMTT